ncbi:MAG: hypothetical protein ACYS9C_19620 [Planctomycetota bacterium]|jgi:hypothetical protein
MKKELINNLPWERNADGSYAELKSDLLPLKRAGLGLKLLAIAKMMDVSVISANFNGHPVVFQPWVTVAIDCKTSLNFYGCYQLGYEREEGKPDLCMRTCSWEQINDYEQFEQAKNKQEYVLSDKQLEVKSIFTTISDHQEVATLCDEVISMNLRGLSLEHCQRDRNKCIELNCEIVSPSMPWSTSFAYNPRRFRNNLFEEWLSRWQSCFDGICFSAGFIPDKGSRISYKVSFLERIDALGC